MRFPLVCSNLILLCVGVLVALLIYIESKRAEWTQARMEAIIRKIEAK